MLYDVLSGLSEEISYSPAYEVKIGPFCSFKVQFISLKLKLEISTLILGYINQYIYYVMTSKITSWRQS